MLLANDMTQFMTWWLNQVLTILQWLWTELENITFMGTNLLDVLIAIVVISIILNIFLSISKGAGSIRDGKSERVKTKGQKDI